MTTPSRRGLLAAAGPVAMSTTRPWAATAATTSVPVEPFPLEAVRLGPSDFLTALEANRAYLMRLEPDRFLHNFRTQAGLEPKGAVYGGWESDSIAGHSLGHYLSALSLLHAHAGDEAARARCGYIVAELAACQAMSPDGYVGGLTRKREGVVEPGRAVFEDLRQGRIHSTGFDLNGAWSPLYVVHKLFAGLLDAERYCADVQARPVALRLAGYFDGVFAALDEAQMQAVLACEYGGLNESFAELYARTGDPRWLALARRLYDHKVLDPLAAGRDELAGLHANTQIPKLIGLARLRDLTGEASYGAAAETFWTAVTRRHSYVIGGHGDREYFEPPDAIASHITEQTCESCNSYNMLKLTRLLYGRRPRADYFDYYERAHLNHILAQQNPRTGMFAYMTPLMSGEARAWSSPFDDFWCCVGTGMESHARHGESIYWRQGRETLIVNLFIPSTLTWRQDRSRFVLSTGYPLSGAVDLTVSERLSTGPLTLALRKPAWAASARLSVNEEAIETPVDADGYLRVRRRWRTGDRLRMELPLDLRLERTPDDPQVGAVLRGPLVLAADLGLAPAPPTPYDGPIPALVAEAPLTALRATAAPAVYRTVGAAPTGGHTLSPFPGQHDRRTAVYFVTCTPAEWARRGTVEAARRLAAKALAARTVDEVRLGQMQSERDHDLKADISFPVVYRGRNGRDARSGGYFTFVLKTGPGALVLRATYWGEERNRAFTILVDGRPLAREALDGRQPGAFIDRDYPVPEAWTRGRAALLIRFAPDPDHTAGPVFGVALVKGDGGGSGSVEGA